MTALRKRALEHDQERSGDAAEPDVIKKRVQRASQTKITVAEQMLFELLVYDPELQTLIFPTLESSDYEILATAPVFSALIAASRAETRSRPSNDLLLSFVATTKQPRTLFRFY